MLGTVKNYCVIICNPYLIHFYFCSAFETARGGNFPVWDQSSFISPNLTVGAVVVVVVVVVQKQYKYCVLFYIPPGMTFIPRQAQLFRQSAMKAKHWSSRGSRAMIYEPPRQDLKRAPSSHNLAFKLAPVGPARTPHHTTIAATHPPAAAGGDLQPAWWASSTVPNNPSPPPHVPPISIVLAYLAHCHWACARLSARERDWRDTTVRTRGSTTKL